ncbi:MAG: TrbG/VirB9 family P-type conjugative transfer protein [Burkholderiales bacterium]
MTWAGWVASGLCGGLLLFGAPALAELVPPRGSVDPRVRVVAYDPDQVVRLRGFVGYQIHFQFAEGEEFVNLGAGDSKALDVGAERNNLVLKPLAEKVATNLTVITNRRVYHFDYSARARAPHFARDDVIYSIRFVYPTDEARRAAAALEQERTNARLGKAALGGERPRNLDYWFCGAPTIRPVSAYDDGVQTRLRFGARSEFPAMFVRNDDESESLLNFTVEDDEVVIHRVARRFVLRRGQLVGCIENRSFDGGGERLHSGTLAPGVERRTKGLETP